MRIIILFRPLSRRFFYSQVMEGFFWIVARKTSRSADAFYIFDLAKERNRSSAYVTFAYKTFALALAFAFSANRLCELTSLFSERAPK